MRRSGFMSSRIAPVSRIRATRPTCDHAGADDARKRVHPKPSERTAQAADRRSPAAETAASAITWTTAARMLLSRPAASHAACSSKERSMFLVADPHVGGEIMRFGDFVDQFQVAAAIGHGEKLARCRPAARSRSCSSAAAEPGAGFGAQAEAGRHAIFETSSTTMPARRSRYAQCRLVRAVMPFVVPVGCPGLWP